MSAAEIIGVGGPFGAIALIVGYFLSYRLRRRSSESGVVETTKATLSIVKEQQDEMAKALKEARQENTDLRQQLREKGVEVEQLEDRGRDLEEKVRLLEQQNDELRRRLDALEERGGTAAT